MELVPVDREPAPFAVLIVGVPAAGKSTVARMLAERLPRAAHVAGDVLAHLVVSGKRLPEPPREDREPDEEPTRQILLRARNVALLADSFHRAGFVPVVDDVVVRKVHLDWYRSQITARPLVLVVLAPTADAVLARDSGREKRGIGEQWLFLDETMREELAGEGHWLDSSTQTADATVEAILAYLEELGLPAG